MGKQYSPIGVFDSGYGGLTVLKELKKQLPEYDYIYLGDNARNPYGTRSFEMVYQYTLEAVKKLFELGCNLVIVGCNTASAKALRNIQQLDLPTIDPTKRVLGVIRPSVEKVAEITQNGRVGVLGTIGTVNSESYVMEFKHTVKAEISVVQEACPMWVPIVENNEIGTEGADYFIKKNLSNILKKDPKLDTLVLGCTHYPFLLETIKKYIPKYVNIVSQGSVIGEKLMDYLQRHPEMEIRCSKNQTTQYYTTESVDTFEERAGFFLGEKLRASHVVL